MLSSKSGYKLWSNRLSWARVSFIDTNYRGSRLPPGYITSYESQRASLLGIAAYAIHSIAVPINLAAFSVPPTNLSTPQSVHYSPSLTSPSSLSVQCSAAQHINLSSNCALQPFNLPINSKNHFEQSSLPAPWTIANAFSTSETISSRAFSTSETIESSRQFKSSKSPDPSCAE
ncbi:hypothetical protein Acr_23g0017920 [Actinidia rufa]|uniref:Uncharacterized protein n=1 Tax=Actinidia rufa TaxID=165716 RepID=A0A7J0GRH7_9ERIC|nr:hypothetical protein Acr_23g0017920 [Actinidia rufa]